MFQVNKYPLTIRNGFGTCFDINLFSTSHCLLCVSVWYNRTQMLFYWTDTVMNSTWNMCSVKRNWFLFLSTSYTIFFLLPLLLLLLQNFIVFQCAMQHVSNQTCSWHHFLCVFPNMLHPLLHKFSTFSLSIRNYWTFA